MADTNLNVKVKFAADATDLDRAMASITARNKLMQDQLASPKFMEAMAKNAELQQKFKPQAPQVPKVSDFDKSLQAINSRNALQQQQLASKEYQAALAKSKALQEQQNPKEKPSLGSSVSDAARTLGGVALAGGAAIIGSASAASPDAAALFTGSLKVLSMEIGQVFLPAIVQASKMIQDVANWFRDLSPSVKDVIGTFGVLTVKIAAVAYFGLKVNAVYTAMIVNYGSVAVAAGSAAAATTGVAAASVAATTAVTGTTTAVVAATTAMGGAATATGGFGVALMGLARAHPVLLAITAALAAAAVVPRVAPNNQGGVRGGIGGAAAGGAAGAAVGSFVPGIGTGIGFVVGATAGAIAGSRPGENVQGNGMMSGSAFQPRIMNDATDVYNELLLATQKSELEQRQLELIMQGNASLQQIVANTGGSPAPTPEPV